MTDETSAHVAETGASRFAVRIDVGRHAIIGDEPAATGGADLGPSPFQLLAAALGECTAMTVRWYAERQKWPVDHVAVDVTHRKEIVEGRHDEIPEQDFYLVGTIDEVAERFRKRQAA